MTIAVYMAFFLCTVFKMIWQVFDKKHYFCFFIKAEIKLLSLTEGCGDQVNTESSVTFLETELKKRHKTAYTYQSLFDFYYAHLN